ncbi:hypothetical protein MKX01_034407 [Papaver californicum]|nr:hypothetical protein MKX01_034407 [Papaver californicum]
MFRHCGDIRGNYSDLLCFFESSGSPSQTNYLFLAVVIDAKIFCVHGGLSPHLKNFDQIRDISRPVDVPDKVLLCDLLWSDPDKDFYGWRENDNGVSCTFGSDKLTKFLDNNDMDLICRAHQVSCSIPGCGRGVRVICWSRVGNHILCSKLLLGT